MVNRYKHNLNLLVLFIKTYDSIRKDKLYAIMRSTKIRETATKIIIMAHKNTLVGSELSETFEMNR